MKEKELVDISINLVTEITRGQELEEIFDYMDEDTLFIGPYNEIVEKSKDNIKKLFEREQIDGNYVIDSITTYTAKTSSKSCQVVLFYRIIYYNDEIYPTIYHRRAEFSWVEKKDKGAILALLHVSGSLQAKDEAIQVEPSVSIFPTGLIMSKVNKGIRLQVTGVDKATHLLVPALIKYIESVDNGTHSKIYLVDRTIVATEKLSTLYNRYSDYFIRIHASYAVNPAFIVSIKRFSVQLVYGIELPIPEKKYTKVKAELQEFINNNQ